MELCEGGELFDALAEATRLSEPVVQVVMRQVFGAVAHCHSKAIVHRAARCQCVWGKGDGDGKC